MPYGFPVVEEEVDEIKEDSGARALKTLGSCCGSCVNLGSVQKTGPALGSSEVLCLQSGSCLTPVKNCPDYKEIERKMMLFVKAA